MPVGAPAAAPVEQGWRVARTRPVSATKDGKTFVPLGQLRQTTDKTAPPAAKEKEPPKAPAKSRRSNIMASSDEDSEAPVEAPAAAPAAAPASAPASAPAAAPAEPLVRDDKVRNKFKIPPGWRENNKRGDKRFVCPLSCSSSGRPEYAADEDGAWRRAIELDVLARHEEYFAHTHEKKFIELVEARLRGEQKPGLPPLKKAAEKTRKPAPAKEPAKEQPANRAPAAAPTKPKPAKSPAAASAASAKKAPLNQLQKA